MSNKDVLIGSSDVLRNLRKALIIFGEDIRIISNAAWNHNKNILDECEDRIRMLRAAWKEARDDMYDAERKKNDANWELESAKSRLHSAYATLGCAMDDDEKAASGAECARMEREVSDLERRYQDLCREHDRLSSRYYKINRSCGRAENLFMSIKQEEAKYSDCLRYFTGQAESTVAAEVNALQRGINCIDSYILINI